MSVLGWPNGLYQRSNRKSYIDKQQTITLQKLNDYEVVNDQIRSEKT